MLTGDARATDPVCHLSPEHAIVAQAAAERADEAYDYRCLQSAELSIPIAKEN
jgi:pyrroloquinoline quinone biosynthesis protein E